MLLAEWKRAGRVSRPTESSRRPSYRYFASSGWKLAFARLTWHVRSVSLRRSSATMNPEHVGWTCLSCVKSARSSAFPFSTSFGSLKNCFRQGEVRGSARFEEPNLEWLNSHPQGRQRWPLTVIPSTFTFDGADLPWLGATWGCRAARRASGTGFRPHGEPPQRVPRAGAEPSPFHRN